MAGTQDLDTGQYLTYLFLLYLPRIISLLIRAVPKDEYNLQGKLFLASSKDTQDSSSQENQERQETKSQIEA